MSLSLLIFVLFQKWAKLKEKVSVNVNGEHGFERINFYEAFNLKKIIIDK